jgi:cell division protein FtsQ
MSVSMDRRIAERRRGVAEQGARRRLRILLFAAIVAGLGGIAAWALRSPLLDIDHLNLQGAARSPAATILASEGLVAGRALISVDETAIETALLADPWIAHAEVRVEWPATVDVIVLEYLPLAWAAATDGWSLVSVEGAVLEDATAPDPDLARIDVPVVELRRGQRADDARFLGALQFVAALDPEFQAGTVIFEIDGELWATVGGVTARLGRPGDMAEKAAAVQALLGEDFPPGTTLDVIAPTRPAAVPGPPVEPEGPAAAEPLP